MATQFDFGRFCQVLVREVADAIIFADDEGIIRFWNHSSERILGFSDTVAVGCRLDIIIPEEHRDRHWAGFHETIRTGITHYGAGRTIAVPAIHKDGRRIPVEFLVLPFRDTDGRTVGVAAILRDARQRLALTLGATGTTLLGR
jgi:PAS domain S-box-containing protein